MQDASKTRIQDAKPPAPSVPKWTPELAWDGARRLARGVYLVGRSAALSLTKRPALGVRALAYPKRILVVRLDRLGDVVLTTALLRSLRQQFPASHLGLIVRPAFAPLLRAQDYLSEVIEAPPEALKDERWLQHLRQQAWDVAIDPMDSYALATARLIKRVAAAVSVGFAIAGRGAFYTHPAPPPRSGSLAEQSIRMLRVLGWELSLLRPRLSVPPEMDAWAAAWLSQRGKGPWLALHVGGYYPSQRLPASIMAQAAARITKRHRLNALVIGGPNEERLVQHMAQAYREAAHGTSVDTALGLNVAQTAALFAQSRLVLANNSGPLHLAAALGVSTVSTMGPSDPVRFAPLGSDPMVAHKVIRLGVACSPCNLGWCSHQTCLRAIEPEQLSLAADAALADRASSC